MNPSNAITTDSPAAGRAAAPVLEIQLQGNISFATLLALFAVDFDIPCKLLKAQVEYVENLNFGSVLLQLLGTDEQHQSALNYLDRANISNSIKDYS